MNTSIHQSPGTYIASVGAISGVIFQQTFGGPFFFPITIALSLILSGILMSLTAQKFLGKDEVPDDEEEPIEEGPIQAPLVLLGALGALVVFMFLYWIINPIKFSTGQVSVTTFFSTVTLPLTSSSATTGAFVFTAIQIPVAEEQFFRALWGNLLIRFLPPGIAEFVAGIVFMTFHTAVYSIFAPFNANLAILLTLSGAVFVAVDISTGDLFTSMLAHILNNAISFILAGSIIGVLFPGATVPFPVQAMTVSVVPALWVARALSKRRINSKVVKWGRRP